MGMTLNDCEQLARLLRIYRGELGDQHATLHSRGVELRRQATNIETDITQINRHDEAAIQIQKDMEFREQGSR